MATKKFVSKDNLSRVWSRLFGKVLNSKEEIEANTSENMIAGAEAVKEVYSSLEKHKFMPDYKNTTTVGEYISNYTVSEDCYIMISGENTTSVSINGNFVGLVSNISSFISPVGKGDKIVANSNVRIIKKIPFK